MWQSCNSALQNDKGAVQTIDEVRSPWLPWRQKEGETRIMIAYIRSILPTLEPDIWHSPEQPAPRKLIAPAKIPRTIHRPASAGRLFLRLGVASPMYII